MPKKAQVKRIDSDTYVIEEEEEKEKFNAAVMVPWCALAISLFSLGFAILQGINSRTHDRLSLLPAITIYTDYLYGGSRGVFLYLDSSGTGPAQISNIEYWYGGKPSSVQDLLKIITDSASLSQRPGVVVIHSPVFLSPGKQLVILDAYEDQLGQLRALEGTFEDNIEVRLTICSIYHDCEIACYRAAPGKQCASLKSPSGDRKAD